MDIDLYLQPKRRTVVLVYLGCIAVPFAVAGAAYLFRNVLNDSADPATTPVWSGPGAKPNAATPGVVVNRDAARMRSGVSTGHSPVDVTPAARPTDPATEAQSALRRAPGALIGER
jgi:hypothetical protein